MGPGCGWITPLALNKRRPCWDEKQSYGPNKECFRRHTHACTHTHPRTHVHARTHTHPCPHTHLCTHSRVSNPDSPTLPRLIGRAACPDATHRDDDDSGQTFALLEDGSFPTPPAVIYIWSTEKIITSTKSPGGQGGFNKSLVTRRGEANDKYLIRRSKIRQDFLPIKKCRRILYPKKIVRFSKYVVFY